MKLCEKYVFGGEGLPYGSCRRMCFHPGPCMPLTQENPTPPIFDQIVLMVERIDRNIHTRMNVPNWAEFAHFTATPSTRQSYVDFPMYMDQTCDFILDIKKMRAATKMPDWSRR